MRYFKLSYNGQVRYVTNIEYLRYLSRFNEFVRTDASSAHAVFDPASSEIYLLRTANLSEVDENLPVTDIVELTRDEYEELTSVKNIVCVDSIQSEKIQTLSVGCSKAITDGFDVILSDGKLHRFNLTIEDQLNLAAIQRDIDHGVSTFLYHEKNCVVKSFSLDDMLRILSAANYHRKFHTTYFNVLKHYILSCDDINDIEKVYYGIKLEDLKLTPEIHEIVKENNLG